MSAVTPPPAAPGPPPAAPGSPPPIASSATPAAGPPAPAPRGLAHGSTAATMRGRRWGPLTRETLKLLFQRRSYVIWAGFFLIPFLISLALKLAGSGPHGQGGQGPEFLSRVLSNGMYVPLASIAALLPFLLPLAAAMVAGYMIAGEAELGTLRIILLRPVRRGSLLLSKWAVAMLYLAFGMLLTLVSGLLFGGIFFGLKPMVTLSGTTVSTAHGIWLIVLVLLFGLAAMSCIVSMALLFSAITDSSLTALIVTIMIYIVLQVLISFSYFDWLRPWVFANYFQDYLNLWRDPIYWSPIVKSMEVFAAWSAGLTVIAYILFRRKDVLS
jgi:ABC-2 type transport system permease protein